MLPSRPDLRAQCLPINIEQDSSPFAAVVPPPRSWARSHLPPPAQPWPLPPAQQLPAPHLVPSTPLCTGCGRWPMVPVMLLLARDTYMTKCSGGDWRVIWGHRPNSAEQRRMPRTRGDAMLRSRTPGSVACAHWDTLREQTSQPLNLARSGPATPTGHAWATDWRHMRLSSPYAPLSRACPS